MFEEVKSLKMKNRFFADATAIVAIISLFMLFFKSVYIISDINIPKQENFKRYKYIYRKTELIIKISSVFYYLCY